MTDGLSPIVGLPLIGVLLLLNAMFVAAEFALVTVRRTRIEQLVEDGNRPARVVRGTLGNLDYYIAASQLGITMASIALGWFGEPVLAHLIEPPIERLVGAFAPAVAHGFAIAVSFGFITGMHIVFGEFVPKTIALEQPNRTAIWIAYPLQAFVRVFGPAVWLLNTIGNCLLRLLGMDLRPLQDQPLATEDLALTLESSASAGLISRRELDLARHALQLATVPAHELMIPRNEVVGIPLDASEEEVLAVFEQHRHTRYPVYDGSIDNIGGILDAKRIFFVLEDNGQDWRQCIEPAVIVPETVMVDEVLKGAREFDARLIILADEYGGTAGIISIFDVVEYLAGELPDEFESEDRWLRFKPDGTLIVSGLVRIAELEESLDIHLPEVEAVTVGGLVSALLGRIPMVGDEARMAGYVARVTAMDGNRVAEVHLIPDGRDAATRARQELRHER